MASVDRPRLVGRPRWAFVDVIAEHIMWPDDSAAEWKAERTGPVPTYLCVRIPAFAGALLRMVLPIGKY